MPDRRGARPSQVRPRPPSTGRPAPAKVRPRAPAPGRALGHRRIERSRGLPFLTRLLLVVAVAALGITVFMTATGGLGRIVAAVGATVTGAFEGLTATPSPRPSVAVISDSPLITTPEEPYTNQPTIDLVMTLPADVVGDPDQRVRVYLALPEQAPAPILEVAVGATPTLVVPDVQLTEGRNDFTATLVGPAGESEPSPLVTWVLDVVPPKIELTAPRDGQTINRAAVTITGKTQGRTTLVARNEANAATVTTKAGNDGSFELVVPLGTGTNGIAIVATDVAGNVNQVVLSVRRGTGRLTASLSAVPYRLSRAKLPDPLELTVVVTDPDGRPLEGAQVTFTISIPGIQVVTSEAVTGGNGQAVFRTTVPKGATLGQGLATVLVITEEFGQTSDRTLVNVVK
jgi:hypothetical protein